MARKKTEKTMSNPLLLQEQGTTLRNMLYEQRTAALTSVSVSSAMDTNAAEINPISNYIPLTPTMSSPEPDLSTNLGFTAFGRPDPPPKRKLPPPKLTGTNCMPVGKRRKHGAPPPPPGLPLAQPLLLAPQSLREAMAGFEAARPAPVHMESGEAGGVDAVEIEAEEAAGWQLGDPSYYEDDEGESGGSGIVRAVAAAGGLPDYLRLFYARNGGPRRNGGASYGVGYNGAASSLPLPLPLPPPPPGSLPPRPDFVQGAAVVPPPSERAKGRSGGEGKGYFHPSFIEDPWKEFEGRSFKHKLLS
ncbi:MAG: hypothetical protein M1829_002641 [Trizodia sp. TS-e1964]|nr:MAG: hypothetical protein M1829_002641 [Trizodia sp. TS-e1964]